MPTCITLCRVCLIISPTSYQLTTRLWYTVSSKTNIVNLLENCERLNNCRANQEPMNHTYVGMLTTHPLLKWLKLHVYRNVLQYVISFNHEKCTSACRACGLYVQCTSTHMYMMECHCHVYPWQPDHKACEYTTAD